MISVYGTSSNNPGIIVRSASLQAAGVPLTEWQNAAGTAVARIHPSGWVQSGTIRDLGGGGPYFSMTSGRINAQLATATQTFWVSGYSNTAASAYQQTANLQEWIWSNGFTTYPLSAVNASGQFVIGASVAIVAGSQSMLICLFSHCLSSQCSHKSSSMGGPLSNAADIFRIEDNSATPKSGFRINYWGDIVANDSNGSFYIGNYSQPGPNNILVGITPRNATTTPLALYGLPTATQTADLLQFRTATGSVMSAINASGQMIVGSSVALISSSQAND
jgi:hypothetical protein